MASFIIKLFLLLSLTVLEIFSQDDFTHEVLLDGSSDFWLRWSFTADAIDIQASAKTLGWLAFGFSKDGEPNNADVLFAYVNTSSGRGNISDRFLVANGADLQLVLDTQQDWELLTATKNQTHTLVRVRRKLETCDPMDYPITKDTMRVIFSLDQQPPSDFFRPTVHEFRGEKSILFLDPSLAVRKLGLPVGTPAIMEWNLMMDGVIIPESATSRFQCKLIKIPVFTKKLHVVKVEPRIDEGNIDLVRQIIVSVCSAVINDDIQPKDFVCGTEHAGDRNSSQQTSLFGDCTTVLAAWAIGASSFIYPDDVGYPIGPELSGRYVLLQTQYLNGPLQRRVDSSGLKFGLTDKLRKNEAGILSIGLTGNTIIPPGVINFTLSGECPVDFTKQGLPEDGIVVFGANLHTNNLGQSIKLRQIRSGVELPALLHDNHFDPSFQEHRGIYPNRNISREDRLVVECSYGTSGQPGTAISTAITGEVCSGFILFYPRINMTSCLSEYQTSFIPGILGLQPTLPVAVIDPTNETVLGTNTTVLLVPISIDINQTSPAPVTDLTSYLSNYNTWTPAQTASLQTFYNDPAVPVHALCSFENGYTADELVSRSPFIPLPAPNSTCPVRLVNINLPTGISPVQQTGSQYGVRSAGKSVKRLDLCLAPIVGFCFLLSGFVTRRH